MSEAFALYAVRGLGDTGHTPTSYETEQAQFSALAAQTRGRRMPFKGAARALFGARPATRLTAPTLPMRTGG